MTRTPTRNPLRNSLAGWAASPLLPALALLLCATLRTTAASADHATDRRAAALALFEEGRSLAAKGNHPAACLKFEAAAKLAHSAGILLNLGDCYEQTGKTASAWAVFRDAAGAAARSGRDVEEAEARRRQEALADALPRLSVVVPTAHQLQGLRVTRDGKPIAEGGWGTSLPVDPGEHVIEVSAPGYRTWTSSVQSEASDTRKVSVPLLERALEPAPVAMPSQKTHTEPLSDSESPRAAKKTRQRRILGGVLGGVGLAGVGAGVYLGFTAKHDYEDAKQRCDEDNVCDSSDARRLGRIATAATAVGAAAVAGGLVLYFTAGSPKKERAPGVSLRAAPRVGGTDLVLKGAF